MAGIGFELRKLLKRDSYVDLLKAYGYAGLIGSGPWLLSILGVLAMGLFSSGAGLLSRTFAELLTSITYLTAASLILSGLVQLLFTRFVADRHFDGAFDRILRNVYGVLTLTTLASGLLGTACWSLFSGTSLLYRVLMIATFVTLSDIWVVLVFVTGFKKYRAILITFLSSYGLMLLLSVGLGHLGLEGYLASYFLGNGLLLTQLLALAVRAYPAEPQVSFEFLRRDQVFYSLSAAGLLFNLGFWIDKILFWWNPITSEAVVGPLRASTIHDLPVFLAYLSIVPGMAVFLVRIETDFVEEYERFYGEVREGGMLQSIERAKDRMVLALRRGLFEVFKIQGLTIAAFVVFSDLIFSLPFLSPSHAPLFRVHAIGLGSVVFFVVMLNVFFYLDKRRTVVVLTGLFALLNAGLTLVGFVLGTEFYGYGFALAVLLTTFVGLVRLARDLRELEFDTFMKTAG